MEIEIVRPATFHLDSFISALEQGWSPGSYTDSSSGVAAAREELTKISKDPALYLDRLDNRDAKGLPLILPDGSAVPRLPGYCRWIWDGEFCGIISFHWQHGTSELPFYCLGHVGYVVVPWKRRRGYAKEALRKLLIEIKREGLPYIELVTAPDNINSKSVIEANGGIFHERFKKPDMFGGNEELRYRVVL